VIVVWNLHLQSDYIMGVLDYQTFVCMSPVLGRWDSLPLELGVIAFALPLVK